MSDLLNDIPAEQPPPGIVPNLANPTTQRDVLIALNVVFVFLMTMVVAIRFYVRRFLTHSVGWDDYTCAFAAILSWMQAGLIINATSFGYGVHVWEIRASTFLVRSNLQWITAQTVVYPAAIGMTKVSILLLFYRIFTTSKILRRIIIGSVICISVVSIFFTAWYIVQTAGANALKSTLDGVDITAANPIFGPGSWTIVMSFGVFTVVSDFWLLFLPMRSVFRLQLNRQKKIGIIAIFGAGAIPCWLSLSRVVYYGVTYNMKDPLWTNGLASALTILEVNVGIMVSCSSILGKFYRRAKELKNSIFQSYHNRPSQQESSKEKSNTPDLENSDGSDIKLNNTEANRTLSNASQLPTINQNNDPAHQLGVSILRTDSFEVTFH